MNSYERMKALIQSFPGVSDDVWFEPGPEIPDVPNRFCVLTPYGGPGEELEGAMDGRSWQVRVAGNQGDYNDAEALANAIDVGLLSVGTRNVGGVHVAGVQRVGGAPTALLKDDSDRWQFICSYIAHTALALTN